MRAPYLTRRPICWTLKRKICYIKLKKKIVINTSSLAHEKNIVNVFNHDISNTIGSCGSLFTFERHRNATKRFVRTLSSKPTKVFRISEHNARLVVPVQLFCSSHPKSQNNQIVEALERRLRTRPH